MRPAVAGVLAVDEGIKGLAIAAIGVREAKLQRFLGVMQRRINRFAAVGLQIFQHQIQQAVAGWKVLPLKMSLRPVLR